MTASLAFRPVVCEDLPAVIGLMNPMYGNKWPRAFYEWQCFNTTVPSIMYGAFAGAELVGTVGVQKRRLTGGLICGQASWLNVSPAWQGRGLFGYLGRLAFAHVEDAGAFCVFANERAKGAAERALGLRITGDLPLMVLDAARVGSLPSPACSVESVTAATGFPQVGAADPNVVAFEQPAAFRHWRFASNPVFRYEKVRLDSGEYAVVKTFQESPGTTCYGDIVDVECSLGDEAAMTMLVAAAAHHLTAVGADVISTWAVPGSAFRRVVDALGFREGTYRSYFGLRVVAAGHDALYGFSRWHLRQADATNY